MSACGPSVGIVGAGLMGQWHASTARRLDGQVVAVVDADIAKATALGARFGAPGFASVDAMLEHARPRVAHVCTPLATHLRHAGQLLSAGCHVVCEKPLAGRAADVEQLLDLSRAAGRSLCPVHQFALQSGVRKVVDRIDELGPLRRVAFTFASAGGRDSKGEALDEVVQDILPHPLSVLARLVPKMAMVAIDWQCVRPSAGEFTAIAAFGEISLSLSFSMSVRPTEASAVVCGTQGSAHIDFFHGFSYFTRGQVSRLHKVTRPFAMAGTQFTTATANLVWRALQGESAYPGLRALLGQFYSSTFGQADPPIPEAEIRDIYLARDALSQQLIALR